MKPQKSKFDVNKLSFNINNKFELPLVLKSSPYPEEKEEKASKRSFFRFSNSFASFSLIFIIGYFLLPIKYISKPLELFPFIVKTPQNLGCFNPLAVASITVI